MTCPEDYLVESLTSILEKQPKITFENIMDVVVVLMEHAETVHSMSGRQKKSCVLEAMKTFVMCDIRYKDLIVFVSYILPPLIDVIIDFDRNNRHIHVRKLFKLCC